MLAAGNTQKEIYRGLSIGTQREVQKFDCKGESETLMYCILICL